MSKKIFRFVSLLMVIILCIPTYLVSAEVSNVEIVKPVFNDVNEIRYEDNILDKIPDEIVELTNIDMSSVSKLDAVDQENMTSFTTVNNDGTYSFQNVYNENYITAASSGSGVTVQSYTGTDRQKWNITRAIKNISIGGIRDDDGTTHINWIDDSVRTACNTIGCEELIEFSCGDSDAIVEMIRDSSIFVIYTHGNWDLLLCNSSSTSYQPSYLLTHEVSANVDYTLISSLPDDIFATTRLCLLVACSTAEDQTTNPEVDVSLHGYDNLANALYKKGVQTVVAFNKTVFSPASDEYQGAFLRALAEENTLGEAIEYAEEYFLLNYPEYENQSGLLMNPWIEIIGNDDMSATFSF